MGGARALIASLGASIPLVAGAALSLLVVSLVFAYDGFTSDIDSPASRAALRLDASAPASARERRAARRDAAPVVITAKPTPLRAEPESSASRASRRVGRGQRDTTPPRFDPGVQQPDRPPRRRRRTPAAAAPRSATACAMSATRSTATVQGTGKSAGDATAPLLGPPVAQAIQDVLDLLTSVLEGATGALAGTLDKSAPAPLERQREGLLEQLADASEELRGVGAVEDAVVAGQRDAHRVAGDELAVADDGTLARSRRPPGSPPAAG